MLRDDGASAIAEGWMLNELVRRLSGRHDRRDAERVRKRYPIAWLRANTLVPALGLEISEKGLLFATKEAPPKAETLDVAFDVAGRRIRARLTVVRQGSMMHEGVEYAVIAGIFQGIAADDWDAVVRFCKGVADPGNKAADELSALAGAPDDAYRLLPLKVQERIVALLVGAGRLAPEGDTKNPLLRMHYIGKGRNGEHRLSVHSRRNLEGEALTFDSALTVDDAGNVHLER
jgi:PilZ domain